MEFKPGLVSAVAQDRAKVLDIHHFVNLCTQCSIIKFQHKKDKMNELEKSFRMKITATLITMGSPKCMDARGMF